MHRNVHNLIQIEKEIQSNITNLDVSTKLPKIIAVSKTHPMSSILPLINHGHLDFGENKVQEAIDKWQDTKQQFDNLNLHMIGKLQTNKVKQAISLFDFIHSVDNFKLAEKIANEQIKQKKKITLNSIKNNLYTSDIPDPELLIRTGGQNRLSDFMLWQMSYTEIFFLKKLWPDFNKSDFKKILQGYKKIKRNFGSIDD